MQGDLAIALGREPIAAGTQAVANLAIAVELAVDDEVNSAVGAGHRLLAVVQSNDGQARVPERPPAIARRPAARTVRSAMLQAPECRIPTFDREPATRQGGEDSTHPSCPLAVPADDAVITGMPQTVESDGQIRTLVGSPVFRCYSPARPSCGVTLERSAVSYHHIPQ